MKLKIFGIQAKCAGGIKVRFDGERGLAKYLFFSPVEPQIQPGMHNVIDPFITRIISWQ